MSKKTIPNKIILLIIILIVISAIVLFLKNVAPGDDKNNSLLTSKKEPVEYTSKRILAIISDIKWREGHIQFDHLKLMGFNLTIVKASQYKSDMLNNADVVMFDYASDSVDIKDKDSIRNFVEKKGNNVIFISPVGLSAGWKKDRYSNTPFINLDTKAVKARVGLNTSELTIPTTQYNQEWIYQLNEFGSRNIKAWNKYYFILSNRTQVPVAYILDFPSGGHYIIYSGSYLTLLPPELIQSLIYLDEPHFETVYTKDNIKNNFTYIIRIDDVGDQSKKLKQEKDWNSMLEFDKLADNYGFGVNHLVILNRTQGADDVLAYLRGYKNGRWIALHGWKHDKPDGIHPEFEIDDKAFQEDILRKSKERFYGLFGYYPGYIATPWNEYRYNFSKNISDDEYGSLTLFKKQGLFVYSLYPEQGNTYTPFMLDNVIIIQGIQFDNLNNLGEFNRLISGASSSGWIIENWGHYFDKNVSLNSKNKYDIVSRYKVWNPDPTELAEFLHSISGLGIDWKIDGKGATIELKSNYVVPAGFTLKLMDNKSINEAYIDNTSYNYFTDKKLVFPELSKGVHIVKIFFKK